MVRPELEYKALIVQICTPWRQSITILYKSPKKTRVSIVFAN
jgi:hypothetical protein